MSQEALRIHSKIRYETVCCCLCGSDESAVLFVAQDRALGVAGNYPIVRCRGCGLVYTNPRPSRADLAQCYPVDEYFSIQDGEFLEHGVGSARISLGRRAAGTFRNLALNYSSRNARAPLWLRGLRRLLVLATRPIAHLQFPAFISEGRFFEIGFGGGGYLRNMRSLGWKTFGIEISENVCRRARVWLGLNVFVSDGSSIALKSGTVDVVYMHHVLEHLPDPVFALREAHRVLRGGGNLIVEVPNFDSWQSRHYGKNWRALEIPRHLYHFTADSLQAIVNGGGFDKVKISHVVAHAANIFHAATPPFPRFDGPAMESWWWSSAPLLIALSYLAPLLGLADALIVHAHKETS